jgi:hypothetical protein
MGSVDPFDSRDDHQPPIPTEVVFFGSLNRLASCFLWFF